MTIDYGLPVCLADSSSVKACGLFPVRRDPKNKAGFGVYNQPEIVFFALYFDHGFICVPFIGVELQRRNELYCNILKQRSKAGTPIANGGMGNLNLHGSLQNQGDVAEGIFTQVKHAQGHEDYMDKIAHTFKVGFAKQL